MLADGLIAPSRLYVLAIDYIPDSMKICGKGSKSIAVFEAATITPAPSNVIDGIEVELPTVVLTTLLATAMILGWTLVNATLCSLY